MVEAEAVVSAPRAPGWRPLDLAALEECLQLLARAVRQFHAYPPTSPLCLDAVAACYHALAALEGRERIVIRVAPHELLVDEVGVGTGTSIEHELALRLHRARVSTLSIDATASLRDLSLFCADLVEASRSAHGGPTLAERLLEHGVDAIVPRMACRPEVIDVGMPPDAVCEVVAHERRRRESFEAGGPAAHLYPPDKGWIRLDPAASLDAVSLIDLAILLEDPRELATVLLRLTDDAGGPAGTDSALEQKFADVATLFAAMDGRLARLMFARLARAVLDLDPERREDLLRRTILPGLLEARAEGTVLHDFPDVDLAQALCLLLDLETAAPDVLAAALDRMDLTPERRRAVLPLLGAAVQTRTGGATAGGRPPSEAAVDRYAESLVRIETGTSRSFAEFAGFDLSMDAPATAAVNRVREDVQGADPAAVQLACLVDLVRLEPNPVIVGRFLERASRLLDHVEQQGRWQNLAAWLTHLRNLVSGLTDRRPDVADTIDRQLNDSCPRDRVLALLDLYDAGGDSRLAAKAIVEACHGGVARCAVTLLEDPDLQPRARSLVQLMCEHARLLAPMLVAELAALESPAAIRAVVRVLGFAGPGHESTIAAQVAQPDETLAREALKALARVGTGEAATLIASAIQDGSPSARGAAEEALWHLPPEHAHAQVRALLGRRDFVLGNPPCAGRLLDRAAQAGIADLGPILDELAPLAVRFWSPAVRRIGRKAREMARP